MPTPSVLAGQNVTVEFVQLTGATALEYEVLDGEGAALVARQPVTLNGDSVSITIPAQHNTLDVASTWGLREVSLFVTMSGSVAAVSRQSTVYRLVASNQLPVPQDSFVSLALADAIAGDMVNMGSWSVATEGQKIAALRESFLRLASLRFSYTPDDWQSRVTARVDYSNLLDLESADWASMDLRFKRALQRAQVLDANAGLGEGGASQEAGITEITIGESTQKYSAAARVYGRALDSRALRILTPYLAAARVGRG